jgi:hypothetical protein
MCRLLLIAMFAVVAGCVNKPAPPPAPAAARIAPLPRAPAPPPDVQAWIDRPLTAGAWSYARMNNGSRATYGGGASVPVFSLSCDIGAGAVIAARSGRFEDGVTGAMVLTATTGSKTYPAVNAVAGAAQVTSRIAPVDPHLDAIGFSRGRIMVSVKGAAELILPTWPEITRVIEDCRR